MEDLQESNNHSPDQFLMNLSMENGSVNMENLSLVQNPVKPNRTTFSLK